MEDIVTTPRYEVVCISEDESIYALYSIVDTKSGDQEKRYIFSGAFSECHNRRKLVENLK